MPTIEAKVYHRGAVWNVEVYREGNLEPFWTIAAWQIGWTVKATQITSKEETAKQLFTVAVFNPEIFYATRIK